LSRIPQTAYEVDPLPIPGPDKEVVMSARSECEDLLRVLAAAVRDKHGIAGVVGVEHHFSNRPGTTRPPWRARRGTAAVGRPSRGSTACDLRRGSQTTRFRNRRP